MPENVAAENRVGTYNTSKQTLWYIQIQRSAIELFLPYYHCIITIRNAKLTLGLFQIVAVVLHTAYLLANYDFVF